MMENSLDFQNMTDRELFVTLAGDNGVIAQTRLKEILLEVKQEHETQGESMTLSEMVKLFFMEQNANNNK